MHLTWIDHLHKYLYNRNHSNHSTIRYQTTKLLRVSRDKLKCSKAGAITAAHS